MKNFIRTVNGEPSNGYVMDTFTITVSSLRGASSEAVKAAIEQYYEVARIEKTSETFVVS